MFKEVYKFSVYMCKVIIEQLLEALTRNDIATIGNVARFISDS